MDREQIIKEVENILEEIGECGVRLSDGDVLEIVPSENFIGGIEGHYASENLGNVAYSNARDVVEELLNFVKSIGLTVKEVEYL